MRTDWEGLLIGLAVFGVLAAVFIPFLIWDRRCIKEQALKSAYRLLRTGMREKQVLRLLGKPDRIRKDGIMEWRSEAHLFRKTRTNECAVRIEVAFQDGIVTHFSGQNVKEE